MSYDAYGRYIGDDPILKKLEEDYTKSLSQDSVEGVDTSISNEEQEIVNDAMPRFDKDISYTPTTILEDSEAMSVIKSYMEDFAGIVEGDMSDEELVEDYLVRMRKFSAGQSVVTGSEVLQLTSAAKRDKDKLRNAGMAYDVFDKFDGVFSDDYTWGETFDALGTYARAIIIDPTTALGFGAGRLFAGVGAKSASAVIKKVATDAAQKSMVELAKQSSKKTVSNLAKRRTAEFASRRAVENTMKNASTQTALKTAAKKELAGSIGMDAALALGVDYAYQQGMIMTGRQEEWSPFQSGLTALGVLGGGILTGGLQLTNKAIAKKQSTILDEVFGGKAVSDKEFLENIGEEVKKFTDIPRLKIASAKSKKLNTKKFKDDMSRLFDSFDPKKSGSDFQQKVSKGRLTKEGREILYYDDFFRQFLLGRDELIKNGKVVSPKVKGLAEILVENNVRFEGARYDGDNVTNFIADIMVELENTTMGDFFKQNLKRTIGTQYKKKDFKTLSEIFASKQSMAGAQLQISSELAKILGVKEGLSVNDSKVFTDYISTINPDMNLESFKKLYDELPLDVKSKMNLDQFIEKELSSRGSLKKNIDYFQNWTIQAIVTNPGTTALNILGTVKRGMVEQTADIVRAGLYTIAGAKGIVTGDFSSMTKGINILRAVPRRFGSLVAPNATRQEVEAYFALRPQVRESLLRYLSGGVENRKIMEEFGLDSSSRFDIKMLENYKDFFQKLYAVRAQDVFFKVQNFRYNLERNLLEEYGQTYNQFKKRKDILEVMSSKKYLALEVMSVNQTNKGVFAKSYATNKNINEYAESMSGVVEGMATAIEKFRKIPIIGINIPFGQFFNGTVDFISELSGAKFLYQTASDVSANRKIKSKYGVTASKALDNVDKATNLSDAQKAIAKENILKEARYFTPKERMRTASSAMAFYAGTYFYSNKEVEYLQQGLSWKEERASDGTVVTKEYDFPESFIKWSARLLAHLRTGTEVPVEMRDAFFETFGLKALYRTLDQNFGKVADYFEDIKDVPKQIQYEGVLSSFKEFMGVTASPLIQSFVSGGLRPIDPINQVIGIAKGGDRIELDRKTGFVGLNNSLRYVDQIFTPILQAAGAVEKESATTDEKSMTLGRLLGYRENVGQSSTEKMFNFIERPTWKTNIRTPFVKINNRLNEVARLTLEHEARNLITSEGFRDLTLDEKRYMVTKIISKAKKKTKEILQGSHSFEDRKTGDIYKLHSAGRGEDRIKQALQEINYRDENNEIILDITELDESQLEYLTIYIDNNKDRLDKSILEKGVSLID